MNKENDTKSYLRFSLCTRIQHIVLFTTFFILVFTGFPLLFPNIKVLRYFLIIPSAFELRGIIHRTAAVILILLCIFHIFYILLKEEANKSFREMIPNLKDIKDAICSVMYNLGVVSKHPNFGKFNFIEKFEYLAMGWGSVVMIVTGVVLWFENFFMQFFPKWVMDITTIIHGFEAMLAFLAIIVWHMYNVHFNPEVFPMSRMWIDGKISEEDMIKHHPLEYEKLKAVGEKNENKTF